MNVKPWVDLRLPRGVSERLVRDRRAVPDFQREGWIRLYLLGPEDEEQARRLVDLDEALNWPGQIHLVFR